jgi:hypothetical protein
MATAIVRGVTINYQVLGDDGSRLAADAEIVQIMAGFMRKHLG